MTETHAMLDTVDAHVDALIAELERVKKERDEALKDSARLDWLCQQQAEQGEFSITGQEVSPSDTPRLQLTFLIDSAGYMHEGASLRAAIDNAMSADK